MSQMHFIGGEKGGVGKSVLSRLLAQYHIDQDLPFRAFDTDCSHGAMLRFYGGYTTPIALDDFSSADQLMEAALEQNQNILVDLAAQTSRPLFQWIDENDLLGLATEEGIGVILWHVMDDGADGIGLLAQLFEQLPSGARYVVVKNLGRGKDFSNFEASRARESATALAAPVIELPELHAATMRKVDYGNLSFWAAANNAEAGLGLMDRQRVKVWMRKAYRQFDAIAESIA
ncbi:mobilization protein [Lamprobacter modestohalophilus]|uniref:mobilization protein n=1 Tax=Lamprobacter modestohalophilus TaxID=1064514 RepID=UPI002ADEF7D7|nr:mobilization protein [Lamprobacter modestohalophilus]MEA1052892.1 mobilization protein [Lamprobacter modestohalophilus]